MYFYNRATDIDAIEPVPSTTTTTVHLDAQESPRKSIEWNNGTVESDANPESIKNGSVSLNYAQANHETVLASTNGESLICGKYIYNWTFIINWLIKSLSGNNGVANGVEDTSAKLRWSRARKLLWAHFKSGYSQPTVLVWSFWWALATGGFFMVSRSYVEVVKFRNQRYTRVLLHLEQLLV